MRRTLRPLFWILLSVLLLRLAATSADTWKPLANDGLHDPQAPGVSLLQEPSEALSVLPPDSVGNRVRWVKALADGYISPRTNIFPQTEVQVLDLDVLMKRTGEMPMVLFPHRPHTLWLDCSNCHDQIFKRKAGTTPVNMMQILQGNYCGQCHGAVAFPLTQCRRCHQVARKNVIR